MALTGGGTEAELLEMSARYNALAALCSENLGALRTRKPGGAGQRLQAALQSQLDTARDALPLVVAVQEAALRFDFDAETPGNGYRSFLYVMGHAVDRAAKHAARLRDERDAYTFSAATHAARAEETAAQLHSLYVCLQELRALLDLSPGDVLYIDEEHTQEFLEFADRTHAEPFYGALIGFHFAPSMRTLMRRVGITTATYSVVFESRKWAVLKAAQALWAWKQFAFSPEKRGQQLAHVSKMATLEFCKSFWFLAESDALLRMQSFQGPQLPVNKMVTMAATQPLTLGDVTVPAPSSHVPARDLRGLLLCALPATQRCARLVLHFHGGGFVAQSPRSHGRYLRDWAVTLQAPIFSVDYSLSPEAPYPRPVEEAVFAYAWVRQHCHLLGWTGETLVLAGDSAGGNLSVVLAIKCAQLGLPPPDGVFAAYFPAFMSVVPSPSRILSLIDNVLLYSFLMNCVFAYACPPGSDPRQAKNIPRDVDLSPWLADDALLRKLPPVSVLGLHLDPCLDDCVMFSRRLRRLGNRVTLDLLGGLPHAFLNFTMLSPEARHGSDLCVKRIAELLDGAAPKSETSAPKSEICAPKSEICAPKSETSSPKSETSSPKSEISAPNGNNSVSNGNIGAPKGNISTPYGHTSVLHSDVDSQKAVPVE